MKILSLIIGLIMTSQCLSNSYLITDFNISEPAISLIKSAVNEDATLTFSVPPSTIEWKKNEVEYGYITWFSFSRNLNNIKENGSFEIGFIKIGFKNRKRTFCEISDFLLVVNSTKVSPLDVLNKGVLINKKNC